jgi:O-antigen biosynthesis protein
VSTNTISGGMVSKAILVTGMHRSGTSVLARIINLHGAAIGSRLLEATSDNAGGYWENWHVVMFHERVLRELGIAWDSACAIPASWAATEQFSNYVDELCELITSEFGGQQLWMVKDPRLCRLLPLWIAALDKLGIEPNFVFETRHPEEVVGSLIKRDSLGAGIASMLWLDYLREAVVATHGHKRTMLIYDDVLSDWQACLQRVSSALDIDWPVPSEQCAEDVRAFVDPSMQHHSSKGSNLIPGIWRDDIHGVFEACRAASRSAEGWAVLEACMESAEKLIASISVLARDLPAPSQLTSRDAELAEQKAHFHRELTGKEKELRETELEASELNKSLGIAKGHIIDLEGLILTQRSQLFKMEAANNLAQQRGEWLAAELGRTKQQLDEVIQSHSWRITRPLRLFKRMARGEFGYLRRALWQWRTRRTANPATEAGEQVRALPRLSPKEIIRELSFSDAQSPELSVLVLGEGDLAATCRTLQAVQRQATSVSFNVCVLPGAMSEQDVAELSSGVPGLRLLDGTQASWDAFATPYVFVVKAGVLTADHCFDAIHDIFSLNADCALVAPKVLDEAGRVREAGVIVWCDGESVAYGAGWEADRHECNYVKDIDACGDAAFAIKLTERNKSVLPELGILDSRPSCLELAFQLREANGRVLFQPKAVVVDEREVVDDGVHSATSLRESWQPVLLRDHLASAQGAVQARDRAQHKKVLLMVDHSVPQPDRDAGSRTMWQLIQMFMRHGMLVKFWPHEPNPELRYIELLQQEGVEVITQYDGGFNAWLLDHGAALHTVLLSRPHVALEYLYSIRKLSAARILYYGHDIHHIRMQAQMEHLPSPELEQSMARHMAWEHAIWQAADAVYYPAEGETQLVRKWLAQHGYPHAAVRTIPAYAFDTFPEAPHANLGERRGMMFVGGFAHEPNADAARWFVREVMPFVQARQPGAHLYLLGSNPTPEVFALAGPNVTIVGYVGDEELARFYRDVRVSVAPLRFGAGLKGKVIEAMRFGLPCATTSVGAQGLEDLAFLAVADDPQEFADHVVALLKDDALWQANSEASQALVRERYSMDAPWQIIEQDLADKTRMQQAHLRQAFGEMHGA